jgi:hypothetical protein
MAVLGSRLVRLTIAVLVRTTGFDPYLPFTTDRLRAGILLGGEGSARLPAPVSGGLVPNLPDAFDSQQLVEVDPSAGAVGFKVIWTAAASPT